MTRLPPAIVQDVQDAGMARVLDAALQVGRQRGGAALAIVLETEGSTYARAGTLVLFSAGTQVGWLSGGCLEPMIESAALQAAAQGRIGWMELDTRDDAAMFSGNAVGCRGCQRVALLPLQALDGHQPVFDAWLRGAGPLQLTLDDNGGVRLLCAGTAVDLSLPADDVPWTATGNFWSLQWAPPPRVLVLGAGPEATPLVPTLKGLGWQVQVSDPRATWRARCPLDVDARGLQDALASATQGFDAVLLMQHNFELDLMALELLAASAVPFIGLLGPGRRRDDLFSLLPTAACQALGSRLRSPIGLDLGGRGPEAIALSIAAELQAWRHGSPLQRP